MYMCMCVCVQNICVVVFVHKTYDFIARSWMKKNVRRKRTNNKEIGDELES